MLSEWAKTLADRLNSAGAGRFETEGDSVVGPYPLSDYYLRLKIVSVGRGQVTDVERALGTLALHGERDSAVIVGDSFTPRALELLLSHDLNFMDSRRLRLNLSVPRMFISIFDEEDVVEVPLAESSLQLSGAAGAVAISLLSGLGTNDEVRVSTLAEAAGVAPATAQRVVFGLEREGLLASTGKGPNKVRRVVDGPALLDRYAVDARNDRRRCVLLRVLAENWRDAVEAMRSLDAGYSLTGAAAAALQAPALTSIPVVEAWHGRSSSAKHLAERLHAIVSPDAFNLRIWLQGSRGPMHGSKWLEQPDVCVSSSFRVYADLLADPRRGQEQAEVFRQQIIGF